MKDNVCGRKRQDFERALKQSCDCNRIISNELREERKKYQKLYAKYIKLKRKLKKYEEL